MIVVGHAGSLDELLYGSIFVVAVALLFLVPVLRDKLRPPEDDDEEVEESHGG